MGMYKKNKGTTTIEAFELGKRSYAEIVLAVERKLTYIGDYMYELITGPNYDTFKKANVGDFFKVDSEGYPQPIKRDWFLKNHRHIAGNIYEELNQPILGWETTDPMPPEVTFLLESGKLELSPETPSKYFATNLLGHWITAPSDAVLIFHSVTRDEKGNITDATFEVIPRMEFIELAYSRI